MIHQSNLSFMWDIVPRGPRFGGTSQKSIQPRGWSFASGMFEDENVVHALDEANVKIHKGYLENVEEVYQMADAYLFPTRSTEFVISIPLSVMEALSCGVPVIGYKSFENLNEITGSEGAITLLDSAEQLDGGFA